VARGLNVSRAFTVALVGSCLAAIACAGDSIGPPVIPADAVNGSYVGTTSSADIRLQVAYIVDLQACSNRSFAESLLCLAVEDNLTGTGSITVRATGETQSFALTGHQAVAVGISFHQDNGLMLDTRLSGSSSANGATMQATIYPGLATTRPWIFGDSTNVLFVRQ
jgi:hypothetical protein